MGQTILSNVDAEKASIPELYEKFSSSKRYLLTGSRKALCSVLIAVGGFSIMVPLGWGPPLFVLAWALVDFDTAGFIKIYF
jgi:hypothetical protein